MFARVFEAAVLVKSLLREFGACAPLPGAFLEGLALGLLNAGKLVLSVGLS